MNAPWRIQLLGTLRAEAGGQTVARFRTRQVGALLARLALFPRRSHAREELVDLLWPEADREAGRNRLRVALTSLRRQLEPPGVDPGTVLIADRSHVRLNPDAFTCDAVEFEKALALARRAVTPDDARQARERAEDLYGGELLPGFYEDWVQDERERLSALHEGLCDALSCDEASPPDLLSPPRAFPGSPLSSSDDPASPDLRGVPLPLSRFFGRETERARLTSLLTDPSVRLITLSGPGGVGKTRLAVEAVRSLPSSCLVTWAGLADLQDARLIPAALAGALGLTLTGPQEPLESAVAALAGERCALLVLDNMEHLVERGAALVQALLTRLPHLTCLVTSRRRLALPGEQEVSLPPLSLPSADGTAEEVAGSASARLFVDRAQAARPDFQVTPRNALELAALCRDLDGLPLALELAAARAGAMGVTEMRGRLRERFTWLASRQADKQSRHRSLWATLAWSVDLLPPPLQHFFAGLSVFRGGCTIEAATAVCGEPQALEMLTQLRERSLVLVEEERDGLRFRLLESVREFAGEQLSAPERQAVSEDHAAFFEDLAARAASVRYGPDRMRVLQMLDADTDNLRAALAFRHDAGHGQSLSMATHLSDYWKTRGLFQEGLEWLDGALAQTEAGPETVRGRARALGEAGWLAAALGHHDRAETTLTQSAALAQEAGDSATVADSLRRRGTVAAWRGDHRRGIVDLEEALARSRAIGDAFVVASALNNLGVVAEQQQDRARAQTLYGEALTLFQECGDPQRAAYCLHNLGNIACENGDYDRAEALLRESLCIADTLGDYWHRAYCLRSLGDVMIEQGDLAGAALSLEEGRALCRRLGDRMSEAGTVCSLGLGARRGGDLAQARAHYDAARALYQALDQAEGKAICRVNMAEIDTLQGQWKRAAGQLAAAAQDPDILAGSAIQPRHEAACQKTREALGPQAFAAAWNDNPKRRA